ncbi:hypothetical protein D3C81_1711310 [compost metagenome]
MFIHYQNVPSHIMIGHPQQNEAELVKAVQDFGGQHEPVVVNLTHKDEVHIMLIFSSDFDEVRYDPVKCFEKVRDVIGSPFFDGFELAK